MYSCDAKVEFSAAITPVFRNHSNMLILCTIFFFIIIINAVNSCAAYLVETVKQKSKEQHLTKKYLVTL